MSNNNDELEMIMSLYRSGKIDGEQKDALVAALERGARGKSVKRKRSPSGDTKKIVFRVIAKRRTEPALIVNVLSAVSGVESVAYDERKTLATVIGDYDVDALIEVAKAADIRLRVRDIDINYVPPESEKSDDGVDEEEDELDSEMKELDEELSALDKEFDELDLDDDDDDEEEEDDDEEDEEEEEDDEDDDDEEDEDEDENDEEEPEGLEVHIDDSRSLSEFLKGVGKMVSSVVDQSLQAARGAGKSIADFADNVVLKTYDLNRGGVVVKRKAVAFDTPYEDMNIFVKIVSKDDVLKLCEKTECADKIKEGCKRVLPASVHDTLCNILDTRFTGKYKYVGDGLVLKISIKPQDD